MEKCTVIYWDAFTMNAQAALMSKFPRLLSKCLPASIQVPPALLKCPQPLSKCLRPVSKCPRPVSKCPQTLSKFPRPLSKCPRPLLKCPWPLSKCPRVNYPRLKTGGGVAIIWLTICHSISTPLRENVSRDARNTSTSIYIIVKAKNIATQATITCSSTYFETFGL